MGHRLNSPGADAFMRARRQRRVPSHLSSSPRICRRESRRGGYRDACSIARSLRGLLDACSIPRPRAPHPQMGRATVRRCRPTTRRQSSTAVLRPRRADRCPSKTEGLTVPGKDEPGSPKGQRRSRRFAISHSRAIAVWAKWRRVVGRHARQIRGELVRSDKHLSLPLGYKSGVPLLYPSIGISVRTIGRLAVR